MAPRFTVLLPTHNRADVLGFAIESVLAQTDPDFELLIVGDGCTDNTANVVAGFGDARIRWFDLPKAPAFGYANRNVALREATGQLMAFMAHDDLLLPDHLELMAAPFSDARVEWAYSRPLWVADDGTVVPFAVDLTLPDQFERYLNTHNLIPASFVVYRRRVHERVGYWPENVADGADWLLWTAILRSGDGPNLAYERRPTAFHFRADWRTGAEWGPAPLPAWLVAAHGSWWPQTLRVLVDGESPQATFARVLGERGGEWVAELREGVRSALDAIAVNESLEVAALAQQAKRDHNEALAGHHRAELAIRETQQALARVESAEAAAAKARLETKEALERAASVERELEAAEREAEAADAQSAATSGLLEPRLLGFLARVQRRTNVRFGRNPLFDEVWYRDRYPDMEGVDAYRHWQSQGWREGRDPNAWFSTRAYLAASPDVESSGSNPLDHYYVRGIAERRMPRRRTT